MILKFSYLHYFCFFALFIIYQNSVVASPLSGAYQAQHRGEVYEILITQNPDTDFAEFMVAGFFKKNELRFMDALEQIIEGGIAEGELGICDVMKTRFCPPNYRDPAKNPICQATGMRVIANAYLEKPGKYGLLFYMRKGHESYDKMGDIYDNLKGNIFLPKKEYRLSSISLNARGELASIKFKETGYIQSFTSETLNFKKVGEVGEIPSLDKLRRYDDISGQLLKKVIKDSDTLFLKCNLAN